VNVPPPMPAPGPPPLPGPRPHGPPRTWWTRHWVWCVPLLFIAAIGTFGGLVFAAMASQAAELRESEPYAETMRRMQCSPQVTEALGTPLEHEGRPRGVLRARDDGQSASISGTIVGPKGSGSVQVDARTEDGVWRYRWVSIRFEDGEVVTMTEPDATMLACLEAIPGRPDYAAAADDPSFY